MKPTVFMLIAGEASGDLLAAELVTALRGRVLEAESKTNDDVQPLRTSLAPKFFGAGGPRMAAAGVEMAFDLTQHSVIGLSDALKKYFAFRQLFNQLLKLAIERQPDVIICVDFSGFNRRFAHAVKQHVRAKHSWFNNWNPKVVQYVSPQVWASRPGRAYQLAEDFDLLLSIFPFEKDWYARRVPKLQVEFVGHPMVERFQKFEVRGPKSEGQTASRNVLLLPGSRADEVRRHLPVMVETARLIKSKVEARFLMVVPNEELAAAADGLAQARVVRELGEREFNLEKHPYVRCHVGTLPDALAQADLAIAKSGTVTLECAFFGVPTVVLYRTSWPTYLIGRAVMNVNYLAMPNLLAKEELFPEFIQGAATPGTIAQAGLELLRDETQRKRIKARLLEIVASLGGSGASARAAEAILKLQGL